MEMFAQIFLGVFCLVFITGLFCIIISFVVDKEQSQIPIPIIKNNPTTIKNTNLDFDYNEASVIISGTDEDDSFTITV